MGASSLPASRHDAFSILLSVRLWMPEGYVYLIYLPLAMMVAMLLIYDWRAFPGILVALLGYYFHRYPPGAAAVIVGIYLLVLFICWGGYKMQMGRRWCADDGELKLMPARLFWLAFLIPTLLTLFLQLMAAVGLLPLSHSIFFRNAFSLSMLLNYQAVLLSCLTMIQLCYFVIRCLRNPTFSRLLYARMRRQLAPDVRLHEFIVWGCLVIFLLGLLLQFDDREENLLATDYGLPLLLPLMLWSALRFGYLFTSVSWALLLLLLYQLRDRFLSPVTDPYHLAVMSANLLVFTLTILLMAAVSTRQRYALSKAKRVALIDPVMGLPNLRALNQDLACAAQSTLCFLSIPDLDRLSRTYGLQMRIQYERSLAGHLMPDLLPGEKVYQLPGIDVVIRLDYEGHLARIEKIAARLKDYHLTWDGLPIHPAVGMSYCSVRPPLNHLHELLGELSAMAEYALRSGQVESLQQKSPRLVQRRISEKIALLNEIQSALRHDGFQLMTQEIRGIRGDVYYEILLRMVDSDGVLIKPEGFIPIVNEFGLTWELDRWVIQHSLAFIDRHRETLPGIRIAINLFAASLCRPQLVREIEEYLQAYNIEPWQLIIEVEESPLLTDSRWGSSAIVQLRKLGCRVAIDDFGSGHASYTRLKALQVDMLKIDGEFVRNMLSNSLDYQIIESICVIARLKRMQVIAKSVETSEAETLLRQLGVDYLQGFHISKPCTPGELVTLKEKEAGASSTVS
ncbi:EAL domain-containing protein [Erwinia sp. P6884]|uniref:sensor domain-containing phosphodiesterase n=1 Tax=Erwinia sp. P6884 TaxID=3141450 RepID=UPI0031875D5F